MDSEGLIYHLTLKLRSKATPLHSQAEIILKSLIESQASISEQSLPTYLFASLFSWLRKALSFEKACDKISQIEAGVFLFNILIPQVSLNILHAKYKEIAELTMKLSKEFTKSEVISRYCIAIFIEILQIIPKNDWLAEEQLSSQITTILLTSIIEGNSQIRRQIIKSFSVLLTREDVSSKLNLFIREFSLKCLENEGREALLITFFLSSMLSKLQLSTIGDIVYRYLKLLNKSTDETLMTHIYLSFESLMLKNPLTIELSESLLKELLINQPSFYSEEKLVFAYIQCLSETLLHVISFDFTMGSKYISSVISTVSEVLLVEKRNFAEFAQKTIELVIVKGIRRELWTKIKRNDNILELEEIDLDEELAKKATNFQKIISILSHLLTSRFSRVFVNIFKIFETFFERLDDSCENSFVYLKGIIEKIIEIRKEAPNEAFRACFEKIIEKIGLKKILEILPLKLEENPLNENFEENSNIWLLNLLGKSLKNVDLSLFFEYFLPIIDKIKGKYAENDEIRHKIIENIRRQIWELLPFFLINPEKIDVQMCEILELLNENLEKDDKIVLNSLLKFLTNQMNSSFLSIKTHNISFQKPSQNPEKLIPKLAKFIAIPHISEISRLSLKTIGLLSHFSSESYLDRVFMKNADKLLKDDKNDLKTFEILLIIQPNVSIRSEKYEISLKLITKYLQSKTPMQKRAYRLLINTFSQIHHSFHKELLDILKIPHEIQSFTKFLRLFLIESLFSLQKTPEEYGEFLQIFLFEVLLGLKDSNRRCRRVSERILSQMAFSLRKASLLQEFLSMMTAGFAGVNGTIKAASIIAFGRIYEGFSDDFTDIFFREILNLICLLIKEKDKEVFQASIEFFKVLLKKLNRDEFGGFLKEILSGLFENDIVNKDNFRTSINHFLRKVIKKVGKEVTESAMPENQKKMVKNVIKSQKTEKRREKAKKKKLRDLKNEKKNEKIKKKALEEEDEKFNDKPEDFAYKFNDKKEKNQRTFEENPNDLLLKYDAETEKFHFIEHPLAKMKEKLIEEEAKKQQMELEVLKGKIVVHEFKEETGKKRRREENLDENPEKHVKNHVFKGAHIIKESGETFKNKKKDTRGDLLLKGKPNPYAFIQLNPKVLNKRHRNVAGKAFETVLGKKSNERGEGMLKGLKSSKKVKTN